MKKLLPLILILFATPCFGESYLCVTEKVTGFKASENYEQVNFKADDKYIFRSPVETDKMFYGMPITDITDIDDVKFVINKLGESHVLSYCEEEVWHKNKSEKSSSLADFYDCSAGNPEFVFNTSTLRFLVFRAGGWTDEGEAHKTSNIYVGIGKCSKI